ncbi:MAG: TetR family transcriptional regulator [Alphaproteobacteria bacterium]|nr:MAG: TetR family transcriptional regulator [Alphaproteobacteria bacterium]
MTSRASTSRASTKRSDTLESLIALFKARGFDGASLGALAAASGLGRASLYHHFPGGKAEMGRAALAQAGQRFARLVIAPLASTAAPRERLLRMIDGIEKFYADGPLACLTNTMTVGGNEAGFRSAIAASQQAWLMRMADVFMAALGTGRAQATARAEALAVAMHGALVLGRVLDDRALFARTLERLRAEINDL